MNVVIDTNVLISSVLSAKGNPARIVSYVENDVNVRVYYNAGILDEYLRVLSYERLNIAKEKQKNIINLIQKFGKEIEPIQSKIQLPDESDRIFYDTAKTAKAILITGNTKHYPNEEFILTPAEFTVLYEKQ
jgi:putative PIN family toxin of toxin-antitoxin system